MNGWRTGPGLFAARILSSPRTAMEKRAHNAWERGVGQAEGNAGRAAMNFL